MYQNIENNGRTGKESVAMETQFNYICKCVTFGNTSASSFNGFCSKFIEISPSFYSMLNCVKVGVHIKLNEILRGLKR